MESSASGAGFGAFGLGAVGFWKWHAVQGGQCSGACSTFGLPPPLERVAREGLQSSSLERVAREGLQFWGCWCRSVISFESALLLEEPLGPEVQTVTSPNLGLHPPGVSWKAGSRAAQHNKP